MMAGAVMYEVVEVGVGSRYTREATVARCLVGGPTDKEKRLLRS